MLYILRSRKKKFFKKRKENHELYVSMRLIYSVKVDCLNFYLINFFFPFAIYILFYNLNYLHIYNFIIFFCKNSF